MSRKDCDKRYYDTHRQQRIDSSSRCQRKRRFERYGITEEEWERMFESQGKCCAICKSTEPGTPVGWHTDHDHLTDKVRGILCLHCNTALGLMKDSVPLLQRMIAYLSKVVEQRA